MLKSQNTSTKLQTNSNIEISMSKTRFGSLELGAWILPFGLAQGGESFDFAQDREPVERLVEPFVICLLVLEIFQFKNSAVFKLLVIS